MVDVPRKTRWILSIRMKITHTRARTHTHIYSSISPWISFTQSRRKYKFIPAHIFTIKWKVQLHIYFDRHVHSSPNHKLLTSLSSGVKRPKREAGCSPPSSDYHKLKIPALLPQSLHVLTTSRSAGTCDNLIKYFFIKCQYYVLTHNKIIYSWRLFSSKCTSVASPAFRISSLVIPFVH
jgi:hypothetical protein